MKLRFSVQEQVKRLSEMEDIKKVQCPPNEKKISYVKNCFDSSWIIVKFLSTDQDQVVYSSDGDIKNYSWVDENLIIIEQDLPRDDSLIILNVESLNEYEIRKSDKDEFLKEYFEH